MAAAPPASAGTRAARAAGSGSSRQRASGGAESASTVSCWGCAASNAPSDALTRVAVFEAAAGRAALSQRRTALPRRRWPTWGAWVIAAREHQPAVRKMAARVAALSRRNVGESERSPSLNSCEIVRKWLL